MIIFKKNLYLNVIINNKFIEVRNKVKYIKERIDILCRDKLRFLYLIFWYLNYENILKL